MRVSKWWMQLRRALLVVGLDDPPRRLGDVRSIEHRFFGLRVLLPPPARLELPPPARLELFVEAVEKLGAQAIVQRIGAHPNHDTALA